MDGWCNYSKFKISAFSAANALNQLGACAWRKCPLVPIHFKRLRK